MHVRTLEKMLTSCISTEAI